MRRKKVTYKSKYGLHRGLARLDIDEEILVLMGQDRYTMAHILAGDGHLPQKLMTQEVFSLVCDRGWTVAHILAAWGTLPRGLMTSEVLTLADDWDWTVAHVLAAQGKLPQDCMTPEVLALADSSGCTVAQVLRKNSEKYNLDELVTLLEEYESYRKAQRDGGAVRCGGEK